MPPPSQPNANRRTKTNDSSLWAVQLTPTVSIPPASSAADRTMTAPATTNGRFLCRSEQLIAQPDCHHPFLWINRARLRCRAHFFVVAALRRNAISVFVNTSAARACCVGVFVRSALMARVAFDDTSNVIFVVLALMPLKCKRRAYLRTPIRSTSLLLVRYFVLLIFIFFARHISNIKSLQLAVLCLFDFGWFGLDHTNAYPSQTQMLDALSR